MITRPDFSAKKSNKFVRLLLFYSFLQLYKKIN